MFKIVSVAAAAFLMTASHAQAAIVFTDRDAFEAAINGDIVRDQFDNPIPTADAITFDSGVIASKSSTGTPPTLNRIQNGVYTGFTQIDGFRRITFDLPDPVVAFGADFSGITSSLIINGDFDGDGVQSFSISDLVGDAGFFGVIGLADFSSLFFTTLAGAPLFPGGQPFGGETFNVDNLAFSEDAVVPIPAAAPLLLTGLGALGFAGRRRKAQ